MGKHLLVLPCNALLLQKVLYAHHIILHLVICFGFFMWYKTKTIVVVEKQLTVVRTTTSSRSKASGKQGKAYGQSSNSACYKSPNTT